VLGGPLYQLFRRAHLSGDAFELVGRRVMVIAVFAWLPLLLLSLIGGHALHGSIKVPLLYDIEAHVRFLIALPMLVVAEVIVHSRISPAVKSFVAQRIIVPTDVPEFHAAIDSGLAGAQLSHGGSRSADPGLHAWPMDLCGAVSQPGQQAGTPCPTGHGCISHLPGIGMLLSASLWSTAGT